MNPKPRPSFGARLLLDLASFINEITESRGQLFYGGRLHTINYAVLASKIPGVFNLGGDLSLFREAILNQDRVQLATILRPTGADGGAICPPNSYAPMSGAGP